MNMGDLMKQAQAMQSKMAEAQARLAAATIEGAAGGDRVKLSLTGDGRLTAVTIDPSLLTPDAGEAAADGEMLADLILSAHADAKRKLDETQQRMLSEAAGPLAGMPGLPRF